MTWKIVKNLAKRKGFYAGRNEEHRFEVCVGKLLVRLSEFSVWGKNVTTDYTDFYAVEKSKRRKSDQVEDKLKCIMKIIR